MKAARVGKIGDTVADIIVQMVENIRAAHAKEEPRPVKVGTYSELIEPAMRHITTVGGYMSRPLWQPLLAEEYDSILEFTSRLKAHEEELATLRRLLETCHRLALEVEDHGKMYVVAEILGHFCAFVTSRGWILPTGLCANLATLLNDAFVEWQQAASGIQVPGYMADDATAIFHTFKSKPAAGDQE